MRKKTMLIVLLYLILLLNITGCGIKDKSDNVEKIKIEIGEKSDKEIIDKGVSLSVKDGTLTRTGATLIINNDSDEKIMYGEPYEIEIKKDNEWHKINIDLCFTYPAYFVKPKKSEEIKINWKIAYGELEDGEYRIIKDVDTIIDDESYETFYIAAEFTIK